MKTRPKHTARMDGKGHKRAQARKRIEPENSSVPLNAFESVFEHAQVGMVLIDKEGRVRKVNDQAASILGKRKSLLQRNTMSSLLGSLKVPGAERMMNRLLKRESLNEDVRLGRSKGNTEILSIKGSVVGADYYLLSFVNHTPAERAGEQFEVLDGSSLFLTDMAPITDEEERAHYRSLFHHSPFGVGILHHNKFMVVNPTFCKMLGYRSSEELIGSSVDEFLDEGSQRFYSLLTHRLYRGENIPPRFETRMVRSDGTMFDVETSLALTQYHGERALSISINDITDRKELEKRLTDSEGLLRNIVNSMVDALIITDLQGKVLDVNDEFERLTGYTRREAFGQVIPYPWVPDEDLRSYIGWLDQLRVHNVLRDFDITWVQKLGKRIAVSLNTTLLRNSAGDPVLMVNIARDITERQTSRAELSRQLHRLEVLYNLSRALTETFDSREIASITFHQVRQVIPVDAFFILLYDEKRGVVEPILNVDVVNGESVDVGASPGPIPLHQAAASAKVIKSRKSLLELRSKPPAKPVYQAFGDVERASASLLYVPMYSKDRILGVLSAQSYMTDAYSPDHLTLLESIASVCGIAIEKARLYQETVTKSQEIEARNKELDDFTYVVSHDLKEPLISVEGYAKILRHDYYQSLDDFGKEYLNSIVGSCLHMKRLIEELLQLSRISKLAEKKERIDLVALIEQVIDELRFFIQERKAEINIIGPMPPVIAVKPHLGIVFRNLLSNAIKFCDKPVPQIEIAAAAAGDTLTIYVKDNGIGIDMEYFDRIFMIFQRLHKREEYEGTGAGLTIAKKIIEAHSGQIWVKSEMGQGSTFYFTLPLT